MIGGGQVMAENTIKLDERLKTAADFVRDGAVAADIGTDHGYIPISLILSGRCPFVYASDVNRGPLEKAELNALRYGVTDRMAAVLSDGLCFIDEGRVDERYPVGDIIICGMGGELIARIIDASPYTRRNGVRLILQPMTMADKLRGYLAGNGFDILDERLCTAAGKTYTVISAEYDGIVRKISAVDALLGGKNIERGGELFLRYASEQREKLKTKINGLRRGGYDTAREENLVCEIEELIRRTK